MVEKSAPGSLAAPHWRRALAWLLDVALGVFVVLLLARASPSFLSLLSGRKAERDVPMTPFVLLFLVAYHTCSIWLTQQTAGKALLRLRVERAGGKRAKFLWALGRTTVGYVVVDVFGLGVLAALGNPNHRCLHDYVFADDVVLEPSQPGAATTIASRFLEFAADLQETLDKKKKKSTLLKGLVTLAVKLAFFVALVLDRLGRWLKAFRAIGGGSVAPSSTTGAGAAGVITTKAAVAIVAATATVTAAVAMVPPVRAGIAEALLGKNRPPDSSASHFANAGSNRTPVLPGPGQTVLGTTIVRPSATTELTPSTMPSRGSNSPSSASTPGEAFPSILGSGPSTGSSPTSNSPSHITQSASSSPTPSLTSALPASVKSGSPSVSRMACVSNRDSNLEIYVMAPDGSSQMNITRKAANDDWPAVSPDGAQIAFESERDTGAAGEDLYVMKVDGSGFITRLTNKPGVDANWGPTWSPDGTRIAFVSNRVGALEVYVMDATTNALQTNLTTNTATDDQPAWSPDGNKIAFHTDRDGKGEIYLMSPYGSSQTPLTQPITSPGDNMEPAWSPDGQHLAFTTNRDGVNEIYT